MGFILKKLLKVWQWLAIQLQHPGTSMILSFIFVLLIAVSYYQPLIPQYRVELSLFFCIAFLMLFAIIIFNIYALLSEHLLKSEQFFRFENSYQRLVYDILFNTRDGGYTDIQIISISGRDEWDLIYKTLFAPGNKLQLRGSLNIEIILSDAHFLINEDQEMSANETIGVVEEINRARKRFEQASSRITIQLHKIPHLPPIHGILISGKILYLGEYDWFMTTRRSAYSENDGQKNETIKELAPTGTSYRRYATKRNRSAEMKIENFVCWFKYFIRQSIDLDDPPTRTNPEDPAPPPQPDEQQEPETAETEKPFEHLDDEPGTADNPVE